MHNSKTSSRPTEAPAKVPDDGKDAIEKHNTERAFLAKTLGELLAWYWWKTSGSAREREAEKVSDQ
jgi:hypothetical protein